MSMTPFQTRQLALMRQMEKAFETNPSASQTVSIQNDYATDDQLCLTGVSFLPQELCEHIYKELIVTLQSIDPTQYFIPIDALHLTVQNVRVIQKPPSYDAGTIERAKSAFATVIETHKMQSFELAGLLSMPTSLAIIALTTPDYDQLVRRLRTELTNKDAADDKSYFTDKIVFANISICRYTHMPNQKWFEIIKNFKEKNLGNFTAKNVSLIETNAGCHPAKTRVFGIYNFQQN